MSSSRPGGPYVRALMPVDRVRVAGRDQLGGDRRVGALGRELRDDPAGAVGVVDREVVLEAGAEDDRVLRALARELRDGVQVEQRAEDDLVARRRRR